MAIKNLKIIFLIIGVLPLISTSCNKERSVPCSDIKYSFKVTANIKPENKIYKVGDTLNIIASIDKYLLDGFTSTIVSYNNSKGIFGNFNPVEIDTVLHKSTEGLNKFNILVSKGEISPITNTPNLGVNIKYFEDTQSYELDLKIILLQKGLFFFVLTDLGSQGIRGKNCTNAAFDMTVSNPNKHLDLFQYGIGYAPDASLEKHIYCFRVN